jgi:hypothetical protein
VPKRCHSRPSLRCLLGCLKGDVIPKPCPGDFRYGAYRPADTSRQALHVPSWGTVHAVLSVTAQPTPAETVGTLLPLMAIIPRQCALRNQSPGLADRGEIRRGSRSPYSPQSVGWSAKLRRDSASKSPIVRNPSHGVAGCGEIRRGRLVRGLASCGEIRRAYAIHCMLWQAVERFGEQAAYSPQSFAWCRRLWRNPARQSLPLQPAIRGMVWQVVERFGEQAAHSPQSIARSRPVETADVVQ